MEIDVSYMDELFFILTCLKTQGVEEAVIAGGCLRDMLLQKPIKDIDVFYKGEIEVLHDSAAFDHIEVCQLKYEGTEWTLTHNMKSSKYDILIQLIQVQDKTIEQHIDTFPTPLSRVFFSLEKGLQGITTDFLVFTVDKKLVFDRKVDVAYVSKLKQKYPDWTLSYVGLAVNPFPKPLISKIDW